MLATSPDYSKDEEDNYEIVFLEGFDGPYLIWSSKDKKWKIANPTIFE